jgi:hypothetical protein
MKQCGCWVLRKVPTLHSDETVNTGKCDWKTKQLNMKPKCTVDYNCKVVAADQTDILLGYVQWSRKSAKW